MVESISYECFEGFFSVPLPPIAPITYGDTNLCVSVIPVYVVDGAVADMEAFGDGFDGKPLVGHMVVIIGRF